MPSLSRIYADVWLNNNIIKVCEKSKDKGSFSGATNQIVDIIYSKAHTGLLTKWLKQFPAHLLHIQQSIHPNSFIPRVL